MFAAYRLVMSVVALLLPLILYSRPARALDYVAPTRHVSFQIVGATLMETPYCDEKRPYVRLSIDQAGQSERSQRLSVPHSDAGKGGITGWSALGFPICGIPGTQYGRSQ
jgi:hypothetical protein